MTTTSGTLGQIADQIEDLNIKACILVGYDYDNEVFRVVKTSEDNTMAVDTEITVSGLTVTNQNIITTPTNTAINVATTSTQILAANANRVYASITNDSSSVIYLALGASAVVSSGIRLNAYGGCMEIDNRNLYRGAINGIHGDTGIRVVSVVEGV